MPLVYAENIRLVEVEEQCLIYNVDGSLCKLCIMLSKAILRVKALFYFIFFTGNSPTKHSKTSAC